MENSCWKGPQELSTLSSCSYPDWIYLSFFFILCLLSLILPPGTQLWKVWLHLLDDQLVGTGSYFWEHPKLSLPQDEPVLLPQPVLAYSQSECCHPEHLGGPQLNSLLFIDAFLGTLCLPKMIALWFWYCCPLCIKPLCVVCWSRTATAKVITGLSEADDMTLHRNTWTFFWNTFFSKAKQPFS